MNHLHGGLPVANVFQILGDVVGHLFGEVFEFWSLHVDLKVELNSRLDRGLAMKKETFTSAEQAATKTKLDDHKLMHFACLYSQTRLATFCPLFEAQRMKQNRKL